MKIKRALHYLNQTYKLGRKLGLDNINQLLDELGRPDKQMKLIHVAGTNGKGSTSSMIYTMLQQAGYSVGFYSSPHLVKYNERFQVDGEMISDDDLAQTITVVKKAVSALTARGLTHPTEFEVLTAVSLVYFRDRGCQYAVMEVGLGGRLDATNAIVDPVCSVITPIEFDHTSFLGNSLTEIAGEKAGILRKNVPAVIAPQQAEAKKEIERVAKQRNTPLIHVKVPKKAIQSSDLTGTVFLWNDKEFKLRQLGRYQVENAITALTVMDTLRKTGELKITDYRMKQGILHTKWPGRLEKVANSPDIYIDGSHNPHGARTLLETFNQVCKDKRCIAVFGMKDDKAVAGVLKHTAGLFQHMIATEPHTEATHSAEEIASLIEPYGVETTIEPDLNKAFDLACSMADKDDLIIVYGSFYLIGDIRDRVVKS